MRNSAFGYRFSQIKNMPGPTRLGVVVALPDEARPLQRFYADSLQPPAGREGVLLEITGVGARRAFAGAQALLQAGATALLSWGTAAGLQPELRPGALALPQVIIDGAGRRFLVDQAWHQRMVRLMEGVVDTVTGPLAESLVLLRGPGDKQDLYSRAGALTADMESAAVARAAHEAGVPFLAIRAVADHAAGIMPECVIRAIDPRGRIRVGRLLAWAALHPGDWAHFAILVRCFGDARRTLTRIALRAKPLLLASDSA
jgi:adenosylhomocysteine nucleosidase